MQWHWIGTVGQWVDVFPGKILKVFLKLVHILLKDLNKVGSLMWWAVAMLKITFGNVNDVMHSMFQMVLVVNNGMDGNQMVKTDHDDQGGKQRFHLTVLDSRLRHVLVTSHIGCMQLHATEQTADKSFQAWDHTIDEERVMELVDSLVDQFQDAMVRTVANTLAGEEPNQWDNDILEQDSLMIICIGSNHSCLKYVCQEMGLPVNCLDKQWNQ